MDSHRLFVRAWGRCRYAARTTGLILFSEVMSGVAGVLGLGLSGYTAVLLAQTAVPLWNQTRQTLPFLFLGSATAASSLELMPLNRREEAVIRRFGSEYSKQAKPLPVTLKLRFCRKPNGSWSDQSDENRAVLIALSG